VISIAGKDDESGALNIEDAPNKDAFFTNVNTPVGKAVAGALVAALTSLHPSNALSD